jgi:hypothetical protein
MAALQQLNIGTVQGCGSGCFFTPMIQDEFFPDPGPDGMVFGEIFLDCLKNPWCFIFFY